MDRREHADRTPLLQPQVTGRSRTKLAGEGFPLALGAQSIQDAAQVYAVVHTRSPAQRLGTLARQQRLNARTQRVGDLEEAGVYTQWTIIPSATFQVLGRALSQTPADAHRRREFSHSGEWKLVA